MELVPFAVQQKFSLLYRKRLFALSDSLQCFLYPRFPLCDKRLYELIRDTLGCRDDDGFVGKDSDTEIFD